MSREPVRSIALVIDSESTNRELHTTISHTSDETPDGGYGWICVMTCFVINCFTWGVVAVSHPDLLRLATHPAYLGCVLFRRVVVYTF